MGQDMRGGAALGEPLEDPSLPCMPHTPPHVCPQGEPLEDPRGASVCAVGAVRLWLTSGLELALQLVNEAHNLEPWP